MPMRSARLISRLTYVSGDYRDAATFDNLGMQLQGRDHPLFYLAIPPSMFEAVVQGLTRVGLNKGARVVVEKPFGRDLQSAQELNEVLHTSFPETSVFRIDHFLGKEPIQNLHGVPLRQLDARTDLEPQLHQLGPDHDGRVIRRARTRQVLRLGRRAARRRAEPPARDRRPAGHGAAVGGIGDCVARREGEGVPPGRDVHARQGGARAVPRLRRRRRRAARLRHGDVHRLQVLHRVVALGGRPMVGPVGQDNAGERN